MSAYSQNAMSSISSVFRSIVRTYLQDIKGGYRALECYTTLGAKWLVIDLPSASCHLRSEVLGKPSASINIDQAAWAQGTGKPFMSATDAIVLLGEKEVLRERMYLPKSAKRNVKNLIALQIHRISPIDPSAIVYDYRIEGKGNSRDQIEIELFLARKSKLQLLQEKVVKLAPNTEKGSIQWKTGNVDLDFSVDRPGPKKKKSPTKVLFATFVFLMASTVSLFFYETWNGLQTTREEADRIEPVANRISHMLDLAQQNEAIVSDLLIVHTNNRTLEILDALSKQLPSDTWLDSWSVEGDSIEISGYSNDVTKMTLSLEDSAMFVNVEHLVTAKWDEKSKANRFQLRLGISNEK